MLYANETLSTKMPKVGKENLGDLIEGTAEIIGIFKALPQVAEETCLPLDGQIMNDCEQMFISINRLLYEQDSKIKHMQMTQIAAEKASQSVQYLRCRQSGKAQEPSLFNQAI